MARFFNTAGVCRPDQHYMLPPERRIAELPGLVDQGLYFIVHGPRQVGKTTSLRWLAEKLTAEGRYTALLTSCEVGQELLPDFEGSMAAILSNLERRAEISLPEPLRPPPVDREAPAKSRLADLLHRWAKTSPRPVVLFLDEIDALRDDMLISVLRQLRAGYDDRPGRFPHSVALIGLRDVRDYRVAARGDAQSLGTASPFNVKADSFLLRNFNAEEVAELYAQHTQDTGQRFTPEAVAYAFELTRGQPWLVNALGRQLIETVVLDREEEIRPEHLDKAKEVLIQRCDTHLDSLVERLREPRVQRVIEAVLSGELLPEDGLVDDVKFVKDLGLVDSGPQGLEIANPIYREIIPRALTTLMEESLVLPRLSYVDPRRGFDFEQLLADFKNFWIENAEPFLNRAPYAEAAAQLVFMAFVHKVINGKGGSIDREYAVGRGRLDLCIRWPLPSGEMQRFAIELKVWRDSARVDPLARGKQQLAGYLARLGLEEGTLIIFDARSSAAPLPERVREERVEEAGRAIRVLWL